jgi:hypothetical protein
MHCGLFDIAGKGGEEEQLEGFFGNMQRLHTRPCRVAGPYLTPTVSGFSSSADVTIEDSKEVQ